MQSASNQTTASAPLSQQQVLSSSIMAMLTRVLPTAFGYLPLGFTFGLVALHAGLAPWQAMLMTGIVYAGSSQLLAIHLMTQVAAPWLIIMTTFVVNLRHLLMSSALAKKVAHLNRAELVWFCGALTDEAFALHIANSADKIARWELLLTNALLHGAFLLGTWAACILPVDNATLIRYGLDYAPTAMFIALVVLMVQRPAHILIALLSGLFCLTCSWLQVGPMGILLATGFAATVGLWSERWWNNRSC